MARNLSKCIPARFQTTRGLMTWRMNPWNLQMPRPATGRPVRMEADEKNKKSNVRIVLDSPRWTNNKLLGFQV